MVYKNLDAMRFPYAKHSLHKIVCIGALVANRQAEGWRVDALGASHIFSLCQSVPPACYLLCQTVPALRSTSALVVRRAFVWATRAIGHAL